MTTGIVLRVADLGVTIGEVEVLRGVDLDAWPATMSAVVGPSGSGKTTLFNVLARLQSITAGRVEIDDVPLAAAELRIGLVHQAFALLSLLTAAENVELAGQIQGRARDEIRTEAAQCLTAVGLSERAEHLVEELSGGEQQRVAIARSMITRPQLLLADEPTAQLDADTRESVIDLLRGIADAGATVLIATHDPDVAARCDQVVELRSGRVVAHAASGRHRKD